MKYIPISAVLIFFVSFIGAEEWRKAREMANKGTLLLAEGKSSEALNIYQNIDPKDLSLPSFERDLLINIGIAYLEYAQRSDPYLTIVQKIFYTQQGIKAFEQAQLLECEEGKEKISPTCSSSPLLGQWMQQGKKQLQEFDEEKEKTRKKIALNTQEASPIDILEQTLEQAYLFQQKTLEAQLSSTGIKEKKWDLLIAQQKKVITQALLFIPAVLKQEEAQFHQIKEQNERCQQVPWNGVIPLYDRGLRSVQFVFQKQDQSSIDFLPLIAHQTQTIQNWEEALNLLKHPPEKKEGSTQQKWNETFSQLQEMYLEDQSSQKEPMKELHSW